MATCPGTPDAGNLHVRCDGGGGCPGSARPLRYPTAILLVEPDQDEVLHDQVGTVPLVERDAVKRDGDGHLAGNDESTLAEDVGRATS